MKRIEIKWMGKYYDVGDDRNKIGEIYYSCRLKKFMYRQEDDKIVDKDTLKQIITFIENENESDKSYA